MRLLDQREAVPHLVKVWDPFVRLFHWAVVACVTLAFVFEDLPVIHETAGYLVLGAVVCRLGWGLIGSRHARFAGFVPSVPRFFGYLRSLLCGAPRRFLGHNPAGGAMIVALLACLLVVCVSGVVMVTDRFWGNEAVEAVHEVSSDLLLGLIAFHLLGVLVSSLQHRENLVRAMITGWKRA